MHQGSTNSMVESVFKAAFRNNLVLHWTGSIVLLSGLPLVLHLASCTEICVALESSLYLLNWCIYCESTYLVSASRQSKLRYPLSSKGVFYSSHIESCIYKTNYQHTCLFMYKLATHIPWLVGYLLNRPIVDFQYLTLPVLHKELVLLQPWLPTHVPVPPSHLYQVTKFS